MRFLIGILTGGLLTLFIATAMDAPTRPIITDAQDTLSQLWDGLIDQTSDSLFEDVPVTGAKVAADRDAAADSARQAEADNGDAERPEASRRAAATTPDSSIWRGEASAAAPAATLNPVTALVAPEALEPSIPPADAVPKTGAAEMLADAVLQAPTATPAMTAPGTGTLVPPPLNDATDMPGDAPLASYGPAPWTLAQDTATATAVWVPFHSQMSAEGFAARLGRELDHEFRVEKRGAGSYEVVFDAVDPIQQALLEARVREITGR